VFLPRALELLANATPLLSEPLPSHKLRIALTLLNYFFVRSLLRTLLKFALITAARFPFNHTDATFREVQGTIAILGA
jgi:hypothetical protein